jgi:hypothetical protein
MKRLLLALIVMGSVSVAQAASTGVKFTTTDGNVAKLPQKDKDKLNALWSAVQAVGWWSFKHETPFKTAQQKYYTDVQENLESAEARVNTILQELREQIDRASTGWQSLSGLTSSLTKEQRIAALRNAVTNVRDEVVSGVNVPVDNGILKESTKDKLQAFIDFANSKLKK